MSQATEETAVTLEISVQFVHMNYSCAHATCFPSLVDLPLYSRTFPTSKRNKLLDVDLKLCGSRRVLKAK